MIASTNHEVPKATRRGTKAVKSANAVIVLPKTQNLITTQNTTGSGAVPWMPVVIAPKVVDGTLQIPLSWEFNWKVDLTQVTQFDKVEFKADTKFEFSSLNTTTSSWHGFSQKSPMMNLYQIIENLDESWEIIIFKNISFVQSRELMLKLLQLSWSSKVARLTFANCNIPNFDKSVKIPGLNYIQQQPLYMLALKNWEFRNFKNRSQSITNICNSLKTGKESTELDMLDLSDNDFTTKEVEFICSDLAHIELICLEGNTIDVSEVECPNLIF